jgi:hypothetical protein
MFTKFDDGVETPEKRERALWKFYEAEYQCFMTNQKFQPNSAGQPPEWLESYSDLLEDEREVLFRARRFIKRVLGAFPGWSSILPMSNFGPGATTRLSRASADRSNKWAGRPHVTNSLSGPLSVLFDTYPLIKSRLEGPGCEIALGNKLDWVPKDYKTDRTIAIEPDWNMFLQKGLGQAIRRKLKRVGQDLNDQSVNRFLAAIGSIDGSLATLDLSAASDTVAYRLVEFLIPPDWFEALCECRSQFGFYKTSKEDTAENAVFFEKFSSMGNGFTFELETLIFLGILRGASELSDETDHRLYVYGDDIVVPRSLAGYAMHYLKVFGFTVNPDKSFSSGPFRESCGGHYFKGADVTPFFIREPVNTLDRLFLLHNNIVRWMDRFPGICDPRELQQFLRKVRACAPLKWQQPRILTRDVGDGAFIGDFDEVCPSPIGRSGRRFGWEGFRAETLQYRPKQRTKAPHKDASEEQRKAWRKRMAYRKGAGPDLAALWDRETSQRAPFVTRCVPTRGFLRNLALAYVERERPSSQPVPSTERYWYTGIQVLPLDSGGSWWNCSPSPLTA